MSPLFTNSDIITGFVYEHMTKVVVQKLDEDATLFVFPEGKDIKKLRYG